MFNTDVNHFLQQFDYAWLKLFLEFISSLGTVPFILTFIFGITFILNFKKGVVLVNIVAWTVMFTVLAKHAIDFPRPIDVDTSLISDDYNKVNHQLKSEKPSSFTELFSEKVLSVTRNDNQLNYGFPSGHTSIQAALWLGMFFLFRKRWVLVLGISLTLLTLFSRLYLAHHFLGDVLGGLTLGMLSFGIIGFLVLKTHFFKKITADFKSLTLLWLPLLAVPFVDKFPTGVLGCLMGLNLAAMFVILQGNTLIFSKNNFKRVITGLIITVLVFIAYYFSKELNYRGNIWIELLSITSINFLIFRGSIFIFKRMNFISYKVQ